MNNYEVELLLEAGHSMEEIKAMNPNQRRNMALEIQQLLDEYYENWLCGTENTKINTFLTLETWIYRNLFRY